MARISRKILEKIEREEIRPIGKWSFVLKNYVLWILFVLNIIFGSVGFAISIYLFQSSDIFNLILSVNDFVKAFILAIPTIWIVLTILFIIVGYLNFRYTERGYAISLTKLLLLNISSIFVFGLIIYSLGVPRYLNRVLSENIPSYAQSVDPRFRVWSRPQEGYLAGEIVSVKGLDGKILIELEDFDGIIWNVDISNANIRRMVLLEMGEKIKIVGNVVEKAVFEASDVLPWEGRGRRMQEIYQ